MQNLIQTYFQVGLVSSYPLPHPTTPPGEYSLQSPVKRGAAEKLKKKGKRDDFAQRERNRKHIQFAPPVTIHLH